MGNSSSVGVLGSHPNVVCHICFAPGHTALGCPQRYSPSPNSSVPTFATFNAVDANKLVWHPDSTPVSHMTPNEGNLHSKIAYNGTNQVRVGNRALPPMKNVALSMFL